jgi:hypothetical protein
MPEMCASPVNRLLLELRRVQERLHFWVDSSEENAVLFVQDPAAALRTADLGLDEELIQEFESVLKGIELRLSSVDSVTCLSPRVA